MTSTEPGGQRILLVEPDQEMARSVAYSLERWSFQLIAAGTGREALSALATSEPTLVLLELVLPDMDGLDLCRQLRARADLPILVVSRHVSEAEALASFAAGADGYITKPYRLMELGARIRAALRRSPRPVLPDDSVLTVGDVTLNAGRHEVLVGGKTIEMPLREFELLSLLLSSPGKVWTRETLMRRLWRETPPSGTKSLDVHVRRIRARIESNSPTRSRIVTVRGVGYKYEMP